MGTIEETEIFTDVFQVGDIVDWRDESHRKSGSKLLGKLPEGTDPAMTITEIEDVPSSCRKSVSHSQWVNLNVDLRGDQWSGAYFRKIGKVSI